MNRLDTISEGGLLPVAEEFYSLQGEGFHTGRAAYFVRLGGCNVGCRWCDARATWNAGAHPLVPVEQIVARAAACAAQTVVITGGEPTLHPLGELTKALKSKGLELLLETSGTNPLTGEVDWICLSPKRHKPPLRELLEDANELKVIVEGEQDLAWAEENAAQVSKKCLLYLQPEWDHFEQVTPLVVAYARANPRWRISLQTHKFMGIL